LTAKTFSAIFQTFSYLREPTVSRYYGVKLRYYV